MIYVLIAVVASLATIVGGGALLFLYVLHLYDRAWDRGYAAALGLDKPWPASRKVPHEQ